MPFASARARKLSRHWSKPGGAAANAASGMREQGAGAEAGLQQGAARRGFRENQAVSSGQSSGAGRRRGRAVIAAGTSHPAAGLRRFWTASAGPCACALALRPAASRRSSAMTWRRHLSSSVAAAAGQRPLQHPAMHRVRRLPDGAVALEVADDDADGLRGQQRHPGEIGAGQARIGPQHGQHDELRRGDAEIGQRAFQRQPASRPGPAAADRRGSLVRRACPGRAAAGGRRRGGVGADFCRAGFSRAPIFAPLFERARFCRLQSCA